MKYVFPIFVIGWVLLQSVQAQDTLWVLHKENQPFFFHKIKNGETLFLLSKRYAVPPARLADLNQVTYQEGLYPGTRFQIPIGNYNYLRTGNLKNSLPLYYRVAEDEVLGDVSRLFHVAQAVVQDWNRMDDNQISSGQVLHVGWIAFDAMQQAFPDVKKSIADELPSPGRRERDSSPVEGQAVPITVPAKSEVVADQDSTEDSDTGIDETFERLYRVQITDRELMKESGAAVFYPLKLKVGKGIYYAFHNTAPRGTIIRVNNPAGGHTIYAKVLGPIPKLSEYHNAIIALSNNALAELGAMDRRMFCHLQYR